MVLLGMSSAGIWLMLGLPIVGMLVLSRQRDESIIIGDNIVITVVDIRGDKVRLGISAPTEIPVHRQEVYEAIQRKNLRAGNITKEQVDKSGGRLLEIRDVKIPKSSREDVK